MDSEHRPAYEALHELRTNLTIMRGTAQLLRLRLDREPGDRQHQLDACQVIIDQTREMERALDRVVRESPTSPIQQIGARQDDRPEPSSRSDA
jgi:nitrogen-specific signal transduction histidine kinase